MWQFHRVAYIGQHPVKGVTDNNSLLNWAEAGIFMGENKGGTKGEKPVG